MGREVDTESTSGPRVRTKPHLRKLVGKEISRRDRGVAQVGMVDLLGRPRRFKVMGKAVAKA